LEQLFGWVAAGIGVAALLAFLILVVRTRGLRRRLFLTLLAVALLPAMTVGVVTLREAGSRGRLAESPGLRESVDSGVSLARRLLRELQADLDDRTLLWATQEPPDRVADAQFGWIERAADGRVTSSSTVEETERTAVSGRTGSGRLDEPPLLYRSIELPTGAILWGLRRLDRSLVADLDSAGRGAAGLRQLGLYYEKILQGRALLVAATVLLLSVLLALLVSTALTGRMVAPLADLVRATRRVTEGEREFVLDARAVDEVNDLQIAFNEMTAQLAEGEARLRHTERLAAWQGIARRLAHEIKNPLTPIQLAVHRARRRSEDPIVVDSLRAIEEETRNLHRLAEEFSALGRLPEPRRRAVDPQEVAREVASLYLPDRIHFDSRSDGSLIDADEGQLRQVFSNLFKNAAAAIAAEGEVLLVVGRRPNGVRLVVSDDGPGLPDPAGRVFDPEFTTRPTGAGLGLAIVRRIVDDHGGRIEADRSDAGGARFSILWPLRPEGSADG
jgi:nitrogen fixation/metabolism regulation signal transduction histidine kinase